MLIQFCTACGNTLPPTKTPTAPCPHCHHQNQTSGFPSDLRRRLQTGALATSAAGQGLSATDTWGTADVACGKCRAGTVKYTVLQLRGVDEGSTVFYFCPACKERWSENN
ncbi:hypothetical protein CDD80_6330 [Ophiocordyceps camponoti-rufipedis]|uniref:DNA-directed RNA polymerase subunit n=1 Tax=Ophiocordyceps camponoti-rufipedis TaxID=2004952 RepID=A0A2C5YSV3_9HYPO|nr:hypothetical protein CDD80_6330 [Ophiocordyceps camponoti-rufipedis]